ncbi:hypothetical protein WMF04_50710 [Sorangium sp. So ce260]|uniref:hypothetical protein n=1 Tax=Sorangium sp. So ce260 TaxID=3133291 RepID=UPI003F63E0DE
MMKLMKALGVLALSGIALGTTQLAAAETTMPLQDLVIVEETASPEHEDSRVVVVPYRAYRPYGLYGYRPYSAYGYRPYGLYGYRPYSAHGYRPYGYRPGFRPYGWYRPWRSLSSGVEAAPGEGIPTPAVDLPDDR